MKRFPHTPRTAFLGSLAAIGLAGCFVDSTSEADSPSDTHSQPVAANSLAADAFQDVFRHAQQDETDPGSPLGAQRSRLAAANSELRAAYAADPANSHAAFGLAATSLALRLDAMAGTFQRMQDEGLAVSSSSSAPLSGSPEAMARSFPVLARALANPASAPRVSDIQDSLAILLLPTLDSAVHLLDRAWSDEAFELKVPLDAEGFASDSLVIDRSDIGLALAVTRLFRAEVRWIVAYNLDADIGGLFDWVEHLENVPAEGPATASQIAAMDHLKGLLDPASPFLKVHPARSSLLASVPSEVRGALGTAREAAQIGYALKKGREDHIPTFTTQARVDDFVAGVDTALAWLSGPRTVELVRKTECEDVSIHEYQDWETGATVSDTSVYTWRRTSLFGAGTSSCSSYFWGDYGNAYPRTARTEVVTTRFDLSKLLALADLKVFMPRMTWNAYGSWDAFGPYNLVGAQGKETCVVRFGDFVDANGLQQADDMISWRDPSFGGVFPDFHSSSDVVEALARGFEGGYYPSSAIAAPGGTTSLLF